MKDDNSLNVIEAECTASDVQNALQPHSLNIEDAGAAAIG